MTKLMEWLSAGIIFVSIWITLLLDVTPIKIDYPLRFHVWLLPLYVLVIFGVTSLLIIVYRVSTFNDCPEAYEQLKRQIREAKDELSTKGFKFDENDVKT